MHVDTRQFRQNDLGQRIIFVETEEARERGPGLTVHGLQGQLDERPRVGLADGDSHELAKGSQFILAQDGLVELERARRLLFHDRRVLVQRRSHRSIRSGIHGETQRSFADANDMAVFQRRLPHNRFSVHAGAVESSEVPDKPAAFFMEHFRVPARSVFIV